jgi:hypothetical protein
VRNLLIVLGIAIGATLIGALLHALGVGTGPRRHAHLRSFVATERSTHGGGAWRILGVLLVLVVALMLFEVGVLVHAWSLHRKAQWEDEISWLETMQPWLPWERGVDAQLDRLYRERVRRDLDAGQLAPAVQAFRAARTRFMGEHRPLDRELMALGIECYTQAADHVEKLGQLSAAADWDDSLFVLAVRGPEPHHRFAASAAFMESLDLRVRDGKPCAALARIEWAKKGLGGDVPGLPAEAESDLRAQCTTSEHGGAAGKPPTPGRRAGHS